MIGKAISPFFKRRVLGGYGTYTTAFYNTVVGRGGTLTASELTYLTTFENALGSDITEFDRLWIHGLSNAIAAKTSFVNPSSTMITAVNSPTFTAYQGFTSDGATSYLDLNYNPLTDSVKLTVNSALFGGYFSSVPANNFIEGGVVGLNGIYNYRSVSLFNTNIVANNDYSTSQDWAAGLNIGVRTSSTKINSYVNGVAGTEVTTASTALCNTNLFGLAWSISGAPFRFLNNGCYNSFKAIGSAAINQTNFKNAVQALGTSLGWAV